MKPLVANWFKFLVLTTSLLPPPPIDVEKGKNIWKYFESIFHDNDLSIIAETILIVFNIGKVRTYAGWFLKKKRRDDEEGGEGG